MLTKTKNNTYFKIYGKVLNIFLKNIKNILIFGSCIMVWTHYSRIYPYKCK